MEKMLVKSLGQQCAKELILAVKSLKKDRHEADYGIKLFAKQDTDNCIHKAYFVLGILKKLTTKKRLKRKVAERFI